jgi:hypothetical protein
MRTRCGFVSNSSSSSFCVLGTYLNRKEVEENIDKLIEFRYINPYIAGKWDSNVSEDYFSKDNIDNLFEAWENKESILVGIDIENKTPEQISEVQKKLLEILPNKEFKAKGWGYYNG